MGRRHVDALPAIRRHSRSGNARVRIAGIEHWLVTPSPDPDPGLVRESLCPGWVPLRIVAVQIEARRGWLWIETQWPVAAAAADDQGLRSAAAYTLGVLGGDAALERLEELLEDAAEDVRFNAAVGLARQGSDASWDTLSEMLALPDPPAPKRDEAAQATRYRRVLIVVNALKAIGLLMDESAQAPPDGVAALVASLGQDPVGDVRAAANAVAGKISRLSSRPPTPAGG